MSPRRLADPTYFFSITESARALQPWCDGAVYLLPRKGFEQERPQEAQGVEIVFPHWACHEKTKSIAKMLVSPVDFPFLDNIHGHDDEKLVRLAKENPDGFPWAEALVR